MKSGTRWGIGMILMVLMVSSVLPRQTRRTPEAAGKPAAPQAVPAEKPFVVTSHTLSIDGRVVPYTATVGRMIVDKPDEKPGAHMFFVAYTRSDAGDPGTRPLTFCFNGGPGSSSVWLHLGGIGPRRVRMTDEGVSSAPPFELDDNPYSLLDVTDLVFIDPVSTGFSRPLPGEEKRQFHGVQEDVASVGEFIRLYVTRNHRWASPKFVLGESYGTTRAAGLSGYLQNRTHGMYLNGIILVSSVLDFQTIVFQPGGHLAYILFLPHYTATAWYHKRLSAELQGRPLRDVLEEAEAFALNEYPAALLKGNELSGDEYQSVVEKMAALTGLSEDYLRRSNLRVRHDRFVKELLRSDMRTVGRLDSRFLGGDEDAAGENYEFDPSSAAIHGSFSTMLNHYLRTELKFDSSMPYAIYGNVFPWNFSAASSDPRQYSRGGMGLGLNVAETLRRALAENRHLRVFCCNGFFDGATPYFGTVYQFTQIGLNGEFKDRVSMGFYEAGHMMYIHMPSLKKLKTDLTAFFRSASNRSAGEKRK